jgi:hypothetical protein
MSLAEAQSRITPAHDGARILWRLFNATDDTVAHEAHVREFSRNGQYVRLAKSCYKDDTGAWLRIVDCRLVDVLEDKCELKERELPERGGRRRDRGYPGPRYKDRGTGDLGMEGADA